MDPLQECEIILRFFLHEPYVDQLKSYINKLIDLGEYCKGYELAVASEPLTREGAEELIDLLLNREESIEEHLRKSAQIIMERTIASPKERYVLVVDIHNIIFSDCTRIFRVVRGKLLWESRRISLDGFKSIHLEERRVVTSACFPDSKSDEYQRWDEVVLDYESGCKISGPELGFE